MRGATIRVQRETERATADDRGRCAQASKTRKKRANVILDEDVAAARENVNQEASTARSGQVGVVVVIEDSKAAASEAAACDTPVGVRSV